MRSLGQFFLLIPLLCSVCFGQIDVTVTKHRAITGLVNPMLVGPNTVLFDENSKTSDSWVASVKVSTPAKFVDVVARRFVIVVDKDGFDIHDIDENDSWGHNMGWSGMRLNSRGDRFERLSNRSWCPPGQDPEKYVYNVPADRVAKWYARKLVDTNSIGEISGIPLTPPGV